MIMPHFMQKFWNFLIYIREGYFMYMHKQARGNYESAMEDTDTNFKYIFLPSLLISIAIIVAIFYLKLNLSKTNAILKTILGGIVFLACRSILNYLLKSIKGKDVDVNMDIKEVRKRQWALWLTALFNFALAGFIAFGTAKFFQKS